MRTWFARWRRWWHGLDPTTSSAQTLAESPVMWSAEPHGPRRDAALASNAGTSSGAGC